MTTRILVVEDHPPSRNYIRELLESEGYVCTATATAEEALVMLGTGAFDVLVADVFLPGMSGIDLVARMREDGIQVPVVAVSAAAEQWELRDVAKAGIKRLLAKPFRTRELIHAVQEALGQVPEAAAKAFYCRVCGRRSEAPVSARGGLRCVHCGYVQPEAEGELA